MSGKFNKKIKMKKECLIEVNIYNHMWQNAGVHDKKHPIVFDEDSPELSPAMYKAFQSAVAQRNRKRMLLTKVLDIK